jgi:WD40 repeat protein
MSKSSDELLCAAFNQDGSCFAIGTNNGFAVYNTFPLRQAYRRDGVGDIGQIQMLFRTNFSAMVGGGKNFRFPPNKVMLWDDHQLRPIGELCMRQQVRCVKLRRDIIVVATESKVYVYNLEDLRLRDQLETYLNPKGLCCLSSDSEQCVLAVPDRVKGQVKLQHYYQENTVRIRAHESSLSCMALTQDGSKLATSSDKGTLIRVFNTHDGSAVTEYRRGIDRVEVYCLSFSLSARYLACSSDKGTIHIFDLLKERERGSKGILKSLFPKYYESQRSFAVFRCKATRSICVFAPQNENVLIGMA